MVCVHEYILECICLCIVDYICVWVDFGLCVCLSTQVLGFFDYICVSGVCLSVCVNVCEPVCVHRCVSFSLHLCMGEVKEL